MMMPTIIMEEEKKWDTNGSYLKRYIVHAPEWVLYCDEQGIYNSGERGAWKIDHFIISESTRMGYVETLVFPCDKDGKPSKWVEICGGRNYTADEILTSFALHMMEAGYDTV